MVSAYDQERKGFWHEPDGTSTSEAIALETWARTAHEILADLAVTYHATLSEEDFAQRLMLYSGVHTTRTTDKWLRKLLAPMAVVHHQAGDPPLTALVVDDRGWVGDRYEDQLRAVDELPITDPTARERHAARARLACYVWAGSAPDDGGVPAAVVMSTRAPRAPRAAGAPRAARAPRAPREPKPVTPKKVAITDRPVNVCPTCYMAIPATGICDNCG